MRTCQKFRVLLKLAKSLDPSDILNTFFVVRVLQTPTQRESVSGYSLSCDPLIFTVVQLSAGVQGMKTGVF